MQFKTDTSNHRSLDTDGLTSPILPLVLAVGPVGPTGPTGPAGPAGPAWTAVTAYTTGDVVTAPDGSRISRNSSGTSRATFDSTEQALWTTIGAKAGTLENTALLASFVPRSLVPTLLDAATYDTNDAAQDALFAALPAGSAIAIPHGVTIRRSTQLTLSKKLIFTGDGTLKDTRAAPTTEFITMLPGSDDSQILCRLAGAVAGSYKANHHAVNILGTDNGAGVAPTYVSGIKIDSPEITGFGSMGVRGEFVKDSSFDIANAHHLGYAAVIIHSALNVTSHIKRLHDITPGTSSESYGIQFDRRDAKTDLVQYPASQNCYGWIDVAWACPTIHCLGTHGGQDIFFGWGAFYGVARPLDIVSSSGDDGKSLCAPNNIVFEGNFADSGVRDGSVGAAVNLTGAFKSTDTVGAPTEYAKGLSGVIRTLIGYGKEGDVTQGAVYCHSTDGLDLDVGNAIECAPYAVCFYHDNKNFTLRHVKARDPWTNSALVAGTVSVVSNYNTGTILAAESSVSGTKSAAFVNNRGLSVAASGTNVIRLGPNADFSAATTPIVGPVTSVGVPLGGTTGQALVKTSGTDYDTSWGSVAGTAQVTQYKTAQTNTAYTIPTGAKLLKLRVQGGGGQGGSGRRGAAGTVRCGGGGGACGGYTEWEIAVADLTALSVATLYVTVGAGGTGGAAAVSADDTSGAAGGNGAASLVKTSLATTAIGNVVAMAAGGAGGSGGTASTGTGGAASVGRFISGTGASASTTGLAGGTGTLAPGGMPPPGSAGGGITTGNVDSAGGAGGYPTGSYSSAFTTAGTAAGGVGADGANPPTLNYGAAGGGGGSNAAGAGGAGGAGGRGAGGSGGGASVNGSASGAGGPGGIGFVEITAWF